MQEEYPFRPELYPLPYGYRVMDYIYVRCITTVDYIFSLGINYLDGSDPMNALFVVVAWPITIPLFALGKIAKYTLGASIGLLAGGIYKLVASQLYPYDFMTCEQREEKNYERKYSSVKTKDYFIEASEYKENLVHFRKDLSDSDKKWYLLCIINDSLKYLTVRNKFIKQGNKLSFKEMSLRVLLFPLRIFSKAYNQKIKNRQQKLKKNQEEQNLIRALVCSFEELRRHIKWKASKHEITTFCSEMNEMFSMVSYELGMQAVESNQVETGYRYLSKIPSESVYFKRAMYQCGSMLLADGQNESAKYFFQLAEAVHALEVADITKNNAMMNFLQASHIKKELEKAEKDAAISKHSFEKIFDNNESARSKVKAITEVSPLLSNATKSAAINFN